MLKTAGVIREAVIRQQQREWFVDYLLGRKGWRRLPCERRRAEGQRTASVHACNT